MSIVEPEVQTLPAALANIAHLLGGAKFIGRYERPVESNDDGSRWYRDPEDPSITYQSVTWTIGSTESNPWLTTWAVGLAADVFIENWALVGDMLVSVPELARTWMMAEARVQRYLAADVGTWLHDVLEAELLGMPIPSPPDHIMGRTLKTGGEKIQLNTQTLANWARGIGNFLADFHVNPIMAEATVCNPVEGYATRVDVVAELPGLGVWDIDAKSGALKDSVKAQLAAQCHATEVWTPTGIKVPMPRVDKAGVLLLRDKFYRGYKLMDAQVGRADWQWFKAMNDLLKHREKGRSDLKAQYPPIFDAEGKPVALIESPMVEDSKLKCASALVKAGHVWVHELASLDLDAVRAIKGVGPKAVEALRELLADHGLTFSGDTAPDREPQSDPTTTPPRQRKATR